jgi:excinuclease ABC subunit B
MYAQTITDSMERAIRETQRRREKQMKYNSEHGIIPKTITKGVRDVLEISSSADKLEKKNTKYLSPKEREIMIERLTKEMKQAAKILEFEQAAYLRDKIDKLRKGR